YADSALYRHGQQNSFPAIMAKQFALAGGGAFDQPLMPDGATGSLTISMVDLDRSDRLVLAPNPVPDPDKPAVPLPVSPTDTTAIDLRIPGAGAFNNLGVPGAKSFHALATGYGELNIGAIAGMTANPYFARFASSDTVTLLADTVAQVPTFFVLWLGNNDILLYALDGADPTVNGESITPVGTFDSDYNTVVSALTTSPTTKGILVNIPDLRTISYFNTVPYDSILMDEDTANLTNTDYAIYNDNLVTAEGLMLIDMDERIQRTINFVAGQNALVIEDESLTPVIGLPSIRQATAKDLIVLPASSKIGIEDTPGDPSTVWGVSKPLEDFDVLTETEIDNEIEPARVGTMGSMSYNSTIQAAADADANLLLFDADAFFTELNTTGILYGSGGISSTFGQGGGVSLDGVHLTARGNAAFANEMFKVINAGFGGYIPPVDPSDYTTVFYQ
ncbi:MAG: G-D-S-L family lipolytic protein, partial [Gammaproteobacteria bacterium]